MARIISPIVPPNDPRQCAPWLNTVLRRLNDLTFQSQRGLAAVARGELPDGSGTPLFDDTKFLYLPGRIGGQTLNAVDETPQLRILTSNLNLQRWEKRDVPPLDLVAVDNGGAAWDYGIVTTEVGSGFQINVNGGASGIRFTSGVSPNLRGYIEAGTTAGGNLNLALTGFNGANGTSFWSGFSYHAFATMVDEDTLSFNARIGLNMDPSELASSTTANQGDTLVVGRRTGATSGVPTVIGLSNGTTEWFLRVGGVLTGTAPSKTISSDFYIGLRGDGRLGLGQGSLAALVTASSIAPFIATDQTGLNTFTVGRVAAWSDTLSVTNSYYAHLGGLVGAHRAMFVASGGHVAFTRLGFSSLYTLFSNGQAGGANFPAPEATPSVVRIYNAATGGADGSVLLKLHSARAGQSGDLLQLVGSGGSALGGFDSAGAMYFVSGAGAGKVWTSDANGVGSWGTGFDTTSDYTLTGVWTFDKQIKINAARTSTTYPYIDFRTKASLTYTTKVIEFYNTTDSLAAYVDAYGMWHFQTTLGANGACMRLGNGTSALPMFMVDSAGSWIFGVIEDYTAWNGGAGAGSTALYLALDGSPTGFATLTLPAGGGTMVTTTSVADMFNKTLRNGTKIRTSHTSLGAVFQDWSDTSKQFYFDGSTGMLTGTTVKLIVPQRNNGWLVTRVGSVELGGQTAAIGSAGSPVTINTTDAGNPGVWRVTVMASCQTTVAASTGTLTVFVNLGAYGVQMLTLDLQTANFDAYDGVNGYAKATFEAYVATSTVISYYTTLTGTANTPVYDLFIKTEGI